MISLQAFCANSFDDDFGVLDNMITWFFMIFPHYIIYIMIPGVLRGFLWRRLFPTIEERPRRAADCEALEERSNHWGGDDGGDGEDGHQRCDYCNVWTRCKRCKDVKQNLLKFRWNSRNWSSTSPYPTFPISARSRCGNKIFWSWFQHRFIEFEWLYIESLFYPQSLFFASIKSQSFL